MRNILKGFLNPKMNNYVFPEMEVEERETPSKNQAFMDSDHMQEGEIGETGGPTSSVNSPRGQNGAGEFDGSKTPSTSQNMAGGVSDGDFEAFIPFDGESLNYEEDGQKRETRVGTGSTREHQGPVEYAQLQAELILRQARVDGEKLMEKMKEDAIREAELIHAGARDEGYREGYAKGMADAMEEGARSREEEKIHMEEQASRLEEEVKRFLEKASLAQEEMIYQTQDELLDLVMAVAEKIIRVSLKSSSEIIVRMLQTATEKLKHQEWVYIYITGCDARTMAQISPALTATLGALSDNIRIVPMGDDEVGTCIIETPEGMIDASVSTQLSNMRDILKSSAGTMSTP